MEERKTGRKTGKEEQKRQKKIFFLKEREPVMKRKKSRHREEKYLLNKLDYIMKTPWLAHGLVCLIIWVPSGRKHNNV